MTDPTELPPADSLRTPSPGEVHDGQAVYTKAALRGYDLVVVRLSCRWVWRCPNRLMRAAYDRNVGSRHLDIGVGTGFYLDRCTFPVEQPHLTLVDLNADVLEVSSRRLARYRPEQVRADVLRPLPVPPGTYDSAAVNFVLHCLPGTLAYKSRVIDHAAAAVRPGGRLFGATILSGGVPVSRAARRLMRFYNERGVFHNESDDLDGLRAELTRRLDDVEISVHGSVALFEGTPRREAG